METVESAGAAPQPCNAVLVSVFITGLEVVPSVT